MTRDSITLWLSSTKPITAVAIAQLWEQGKLDLDDYISEYIPEFGVKGKESITIRHALTHTGGFRRFSTGGPSLPWDEIISRICNLEVEPGWEPGKKAGYHLESSWYILAEIVRRLDGREYPQYVREAIFEPLVMKDSWIGMPPENHRDYGERIAPMYLTEGERPLPATWTSEEWSASCRPGGGGQGPVRELGRFYEMLLGGGQIDGRRFLLPQTVEAMTARHRVGMRDQTFAHVVDWGLGFIVSSNLYGADTVPYGYGPHASPRAFGHSGNQSSTGFADPEHGLVVAWLLNGMPGERRHQQRVRAINAALYEELGLA